MDNIPPPIGLLLAWACAIALIPVVCSCGFTILALSPSTQDRIHANRGLLRATRRLRSMAVASALALVAAVAAGRVWIPSMSPVTEMPDAASGYFAALLSLLLLGITACIRVPSGRVAPALDEDGDANEASLPPPPPPALWPWRLGFIVALSVIGPLAAMEQTEFPPVSATPSLIVVTGTIFRGIMSLWLGAIFLRPVLSHVRMPDRAAIRRRLLRVQRRLLPFLTASGFAMLVANVSSVTESGGASRGVSLLIGTALVILTGVSARRRQSLRRVVLRSEAILGVSVLLLTILLPHIAPMQFRLDLEQRAALRGVMTIPSSAADLASGPQVAVAGTAADTIGALTLTTGRDGSTFFLHLSEAPGVPLDPRLLTGDILRNLRVQPMVGVEQVHLIVSPVSIPGEWMTIPLQIKPDGNYHATSRFLPTGRPWNLTLIVKRVGREQPTRLTFTYQATASGSPPSLDAVPSHLVRLPQDALSGAVRALAFAAIGVFLGVLAQIEAHTPRVRKDGARDRNTQRYP